MTQPPSSAVTALAWHQREDMAADPATPVDTLGALGEWLVQQLLVAAKGERSPSAHERSCLLHYLGNPSAPPDLFSDLLLTAYPLLNEEDTAEMLDVASRNAMLPLAAMDLDVGPGGGPFHGLFRTFVWYFDEHGRRPQLPESAVPDLHQFLKRWGLRTRIMKRRHTIYVENGLAQAIYQRVQAWLKQNAPNVPFVVDNISLDAATLVLYDEYNEIVTAHSPLRFIVDIPSRIVDYAHAYNPLTPADQ